MYDEQKIPSLCGSFVLWLPKERRMWMVELVEVKDEMVVYDELEMRLIL